MMKKLIILFIFSALGKVTFAQPGFGSMVLCHDNKKTLSCVSNNDYIVHFTGGLFSGFETTDSVVLFNEDSKAFIVKNAKPRNTKDSVIILQLTNKGPVLKNRDSIILLTKTTNISEEEPEAAIVDFFNFFVYLEYSEGKLHKVSFNAGLKAISLNIFEYKGIYYWDINAKSKTNSFTLEYTFSKLQLIALRDYAKKSGISLYSQKNRSFFRRLEVYKIDASGLPVPQNKMFYNRSGIAQTRKGGLEIKECGCK